MTKAYIWDVYTQALAVQERKLMPAVGPSMDRRTFDFTLLRYNDDSIQSLICFCCARVCLSTGQPRSHIEFVKGAWFLNLPEGSLTTNFSKAEFERRFAP